MPTQPRLNLSALALLLLLPLPACHSGGGNDARTTDCANLSQPATPSLAALRGDWNVQSIAGRPIDEIAGDLFKDWPADRRPSLSFAPDGGVSGATGVNRFASSLDLDALATGDFTLRPAVTTRMAGPPQAMALEQRFLDAFNKVNAASISDGALSLRDGQTELMRLVKAR